MSGTKFINELAQAHDDDLSVIDAVADVLQTEFTMGPSIKYDQYHVGVIGSTMTRNLIARFDDVYDEISSACEDVLSDRNKGDCRMVKLPSVECLTDHVFAAAEWISVPAFDAVIQIVTRTGNRLFVGLPLCIAFFKGCELYSAITIILGRKPEYIRLAQNWAIDVFIGAFFINFMPWILKP